MPEDYAAKTKEATYLMGRLRMANERQLALARLRVLYPDTDFTYNRYGLQLIVPEGRVRRLSRAVHHSADRIYVKSADGHYRLVKDRHGVPGPPYKEPEEPAKKKSVWEWIRNPAL